MNTIRKKVQFSFFEETNLLDWLCDYRKYSILKKKKTQQKLLRALLFRAPAPTSSLQSSARESGEHSGTYLNPLV